jgi:two-component system, LuxR family, response regulator FixJ
MTTIQPMHKPPVRTQLQQEKQSLSAEEKPFVHIIDDDAAARDAAAVLVASMGLEHKTYASAQEFLDAYDPSTPGCLILDVRLFGFSGLELQQKLVTEGLKVPIIFVTGYGDIPMAVSAMKHGAIDFLEKPYRDHDLWQSIVKALDRDQKRRLLEARRDAMENRLARLSPGERQVLDMIASGKHKNQIAKELNVTVRTIEVRRNKILEKLDASSVAQAIRVAVTAELLREIASC